MGDWARVKYDSPLGQLFVTGELEERARQAAEWRRSEIRNAERILKRLSLNGKTEYWYLIDTLEGQLRSAELTINADTVRYVDSCRSDANPHYEAEHEGKFLDIQGLYTTREQAFHAGVGIYKARIAHAKTMEKDAISEGIVEFFEGRLERFIRENESK